MIATALTTLWVSAAGLQLVLSLIVSGLVLPLPRAAMGYEHRLSDGEDIAMVMLATFLLPLAPVSVWFLMAELFRAWRSYRLIRKLPQDIVRRIWIQSGCHADAAVEEALLQANIHGIQ